MCNAETGVRGVAERINLAGKAPGEGVEFTVPDANVGAVMGNGVCCRNGCSWEGRLQAAANHIMAAIDRYQMKASSVQGRCGGLGVSVRWNAWATMGVMAGCRAMLGQLGYWSSLTVIAFVRCMVWMGRA
jgi:hypothetical protein